MWTASAGQRGYSARKCFGHLCLAHLEVFIIASQYLSSTKLAVLHAHVSHNLPTPTLA